jgi:hypothetical protein
MLSILHPAHASPPPPWAGISFAPFYSFFSISWVWSFIMFFFQYLLYIHHPSSYFSGQFVYYVVISSAAAAAAVCLISAS